MALGGGTFVTQNKPLVGTYINFISTNNASATLSDRGIATMPVSLDWGADDTVFKVESSDFYKNALTIFGYNYTDNKLTGIRDLFKNCTTLYAYRLNSGEKASNEFATAKYSGIRGNDIKITVSQNVDYDGKYDVSTLLEAAVYDTQTVSNGCAINKSNTNKLYDGEFDIDVDYTQSELAESIVNGEFILHQVGDDIRVLEDINSLVTETSDKNNIFKDNQTVRVIDQIATDIAVTFATKYLGVIPNDKNGRIALKTDIIKHHKQLEIMGAIEDFDVDDITVDQGNTKKEVVVTDAITVVNSMNKLYMTVSVS